MSEEEALFDELLEVEEEPVSHSKPAPARPVEPAKPKTPAVEKTEEPPHPPVEPVPDIPLEPAEPRSGRIAQPLPVERERTRKSSRTAHSEEQERTASTTDRTGLSPVVESGAPEDDAEDVEVEEDYYKLVVLIVGDKGTGKTVTALSFPGEVLVLSFDRKAAPIKRFFYKGDKRIHVYDVVKHVDWSPERITETSARVFQEIDRILDRWAGRVDWVVIDGVDIMEQLAEMYMRYRHGLGPIEGIRNLNIWKERKWILRGVHNKAMNAARKGVIYTVYPVWQERIVAGEVVDRRQEPRWLDVILFETDVVLWTRYDESTGRFLVEVRTSKLDALFPTGKTYDVTGKPLGRQVDWRTLESQI